MNKPLTLLASLLVATSAFAEVWVPAFTSYLDPDLKGPSRGAKISRDGVTSWTNPQITVSWYGEIKTPGRLTAAVTMRLPEGAEADFKLAVGAESFTAHAKGTGATISIPFGEFHPAQAGYARFLLTSQNPAGTPAGVIDALVIDGPASQGARFNLEPRRNAAGVYLTYSLPQDAAIELFYNEAICVTDPVDTSYMVSAFHNGKIGLQVLSPTERRIVFSVWDANPAQPAKAAAAPPVENPMKLLAKGEEVVAHVPGNGSSTGFAHLMYPWKAGQVQKFVITAKANGTHTDYTGYWFHPERREWQVIASFRAPRDWQGLRGFSSYCENVDGANGHLQRKMILGPQWIRTTGGRWMEIIDAGFSHDDAGQKNRLDRFMSVENGRFVLSSGGFVPGSTKYGENFTRPGAGHPPELKLPTPSAD